MKKDKYEIKFKYVKLFFLILLTMILLLTSNSSLSLVIGCIIMLYTFFSPIEEVFVFMMVLLPSAENLNFIGTMSIPMMIVIVSFFKNILGELLNRQVKKEKWLVYSIILLIYGIITRTILNTNEQIFSTIKFIMFLFFVKNIFEYYKKSKIKFNIIYGRMIRYVGLGLIIASFCSILSDNAINNLGRFSFGGSSTLNVIGIQCAVVIIGLIYIFIINKSKKIDLLLIFLCALIAFFTMSRTAILMIAIGLILFFIFSLIRGGNYRLLIVFILLIIGIFISYFVSPTIRNYSDNIMQRFKAQDISNGRYSLWEQTINEMLNDKQYFWIGAGDYMNINAVFGKNDRVLAAHNFLIETWVIYGSIGTLILVFICTAFMKSILFYDRKNGLIKPDNWYSFVPFIIFIAGLFYSHHFIGRTNFILFVLSFIPIKIKTELLENKNGGSNYEK